MLPSAPRTKSCSKSLWVIEPVAGFEARSGPGVPSEAQPDQVPPWLCCRIRYTVLLPGRPGAALPLARRLLQRRAGHRHPHPQDRPQPRQRPGPARRIGVAPAGAPRIVAGRAGILAQPRRPRHQDPDRSGEPRPRGHHRRQAHVARGEGAQREQRCPRSGLTGGEPREQGDRDEAGPQFAREAIAKTPDMIPEVASSAPGTSAPRPPGR